MNQGPPTDAGPEGHRCRHILVVGGGASGVLMAAHLLSQPGAPFRVTLIERNGALGAGVAYATPDPDHLLNTRVHNMSAYPQDPHHFERWLLTQSTRPPATGNCFVSRQIYGRYLGELLTPWLGGAASPLTTVRGECLRIMETDRGIIAHLSDGSVRLADIAVLATGHVQQDPASAGVLSDPWQSISVNPDERVVIVGSGLTMVDKVLTLIGAGHRGEIVVVSRRGLLPRGHAPTQPVRLSLADVPLGAPLSVLCAWVRHVARRAEREGGTWRDAVDGIRPHVRAIWRGLSKTERSRFLRHAAAWWDVHRHRVPPISEARIAAAIASGQLRLVRGAYEGAVRTDYGSICVRITPRDGASIEHLTCASVVDCRGIRRDPEENAAPLISDLLSQGAARLDPLRIGLDVSLDCHLLDRAGRASDRVFVVGPASRAAFWEITAIPDIRQQTVDLAGMLAAEAEDLTVSQTASIRR